MEIPSATISQVQHLRDGRMVAIDDDVCDVVKRLQEIDTGFRVRWSEAQELFVIYHVQGDVEDFVTTTPVLDQRLVDRILEISAPGYDYGAELERLDAEAKKLQESDWDERVGDALERLAHAIRHDLKKARPGKMYVSPDVY